MNISRFVKVLLKQLRNTCFFNVVSLLQLILLGFIRVLPYLSELFLSCRTHAGHECYIYMSCHYSCSSCSASVYYDLCTSCPTTRTLSGSLCVCQSGYYEVQQTQCSADTSTSIFDSILITAETVAFVLAIAFHVLTLVFILNRIISPKLKKTIDTLQVIGLIAYYRFLQDELSSRALKTINIFNFSYFSTLICSDWSPQLGCNTFQNLIGPGFTLLMFVVVFFVSYGIATCVYYANSDDENVVYIRNGKEEKSKKTGNLSMMAYWLSMRSSFLLLYMDQTVIQTSVALSRIAMVNYWGVIVVLPFLLLVAAAGRLHFKTINDPAQTTLIYRAKNSYFYLYDNFYHLNYIDHIFQQENLKKDRSTLKKPFYPDSNLMIIQLLFKVFLASSTVVFYEYEPYLFAYLCIFLLVIFLFTMDHIFYYERSTLFFYIFCLAAHGYSVGTFFLPNLFKYYIVFLSMAGIIAVIACLLGVVSNWKGSREGEMINKIYEVQEESSKIAGEPLNESEEEFRVNRGGEELKIESLISEREDNISPVVMPVVAGNTVNNMNRVTQNRTFATRRTNPTNPNIANLNITNGQNIPREPSKRVTTNLLNATNLQNKYIKQGATQNILNAGLTHNNVTSNNLLANVTGAGLGQANIRNSNGEIQGQNKDITIARFSKMEVKQEGRVETSNDKVEANLDQEEGQIEMAEGGSREKEVGGVREGDIKEKTGAELKKQSTKRSFKDTKRFSLNNEEAKESAKLQEGGFIGEASKKNVFQVVEEEEQRE